MAPSGYRRYAAPRRNPSRWSARARRGAVLIRHMQRVWDASMQVYGAEQAWRQLQQEALVMARCTVERLMRGVGAL